MKYIKIYYKNIFMVTLFSLILSSQVKATEYYVSQADGDDSYNGTSPNHQSGNSGPWSTIGHAFSVAHAGDIINILNFQYVAYIAEIGSPRVNGLTTRYGHLDEKGRAEMTLPQYAQAYRVIQ